LFRSKVAVIGCQFFGKLTIKKSNCYHFVSRPEVVGSDRTWVLFVVFNLCHLYSLVKVDSGVLFYLVWFSFVYSFSALTLLVGSFDP